MKQICVFLLSMLLTACSAAPDSAELVPYDLSEKEQFVLETFGMLESSQLLSFHAPEEAITLRVHVYQMLSGGAWEETGGGATSIDAEREPVDRLDGYFAMRLRKDLGIDFHIRCAGLASYQTDAVDLSAAARAVYLLTDAREITMETEIPVALMVYESDAAMPAYCLEDYFEPSRFDGRELVQAVTLEFSAQGLSTQE